MIEIIQATLSHVQELSMTMNREDRDEVEGLYLKAHRVLWRGWKNSVIRKTLMIDGEVGAIWGVTGSPLALIGHPWMLTSKKVRGMSPHTFAKLYKSEVRGLLEVFPVLWNYVDNRYVGAKRMLKIAGFKLEEPTPMGRFQRLYRKFSIGAA